MSGDHLNVSITCSADITCFLLWCEVHSITYKVLCLVTPQHNVWFLFLVWIRTFLFWLLGDFQDGVNIKWYKDIKFDKCEYRIFLCSNILLSVITDSNVVTYLGIKYHNVCIYIITHKNRVSKYSNCQLLMVMLSGLFRVL